MSVLIERIDRMADKSQPPADVYNVNISTQEVWNGITVTIKWNDPNDTIIGGESLSKWKGTVLVRKYDSPPTSINDGVQIVNNTVRNRYASSGITDNNLNGSTSTKKIYYRFFTYSVKNKYNDSSNMIYNTSAIALDPVFGNNSWDNIISAAESGNIPSTWKIGDTKDLTLSGSFNETVTMQIWDFDHFDKSDGSGKAKLCLGMKHLMDYHQEMNTSRTNVGGWNNSKMKYNIMNDLFNSIPIELRNYIKEVKTEANNGGQSSSSRTCNDKVFLPGYKEVCGDKENYDGNQTKFPIFSDNNSRIKKRNNGTGKKDFWWTRSAYYNSSSYFYTVEEDGTLYAGYHTYYGNESASVCFCFNI